MISCDAKNKIMYILLIITSNNEISFVIENNCVFVV
jgi:hypothetical protein